MLIAFWGASVVNLALVAGQVSPWDSLTKALLMPLLAAWVLTRGGPRLIVAALLLSWAGDVFMEIDGLLIVGMAFFGAAHVCYITYFLRTGAWTRLRARLVILAVYLLVWAAMMALLWPGLGDLRLPVAGYSLLLTSTAILAATLSVQAAVGGVLFLLSDSLIAVELAKLPQLPMNGLIIMATYVVAQYLLAAGILQRSRAVGNDG